MLLEGSFVVDKAQDALFSSQNQVEIGYYSVLRRRLFIYIYLNILDLSGETKNSFSFLDIGSVALLTEVKAGKVSVFFGITDVSFYIME